MPQRFTEDDRDLQGGDLLTPATRPAHALVRGQISLRAIMLAILMVGIALTICRQIPIAMIAPAGLLIAAIGLHMLATCLGRTALIQSDSHNTVPKTCCIMPETPQCVFPSDEFSRDAKKASADTRTEIDDQARNASLIIFRVAGAGVFIGPWMSFAVVHYMHATNTHPLTTGAIILAGTLLCIAFSLVLVGGLWLIGAAILGVLRSEQHRGLGSQPVFSAVPRSEQHRCIGFQPVPSMVPGSEQHSGS